MAKIKVSEIREKFPMYSDLSDDQLLIGIRQKFYADIPMPKFASMIEYDTQRAALQAETAEGMGAWGRFGAGAGKAFSDAGRGLAQLVGQASESDVDASAALDAGLMDTTAGKVGNFTGTVAALAPTFAIPGAATLRGAALIGAGAGGIQQVGANDSRLMNIGIGGAAGAGGVAAGRGIGAAYQGAKALAEPFYQAGRERIAGRMIQRFAEDPAKVAAAQGGRTITGAIPTIAEETGDRGMARLQDALRSVDPQIATRIDSRLAENSAARVKSLADAAGAGGLRDKAAQAREDAARQLYNAAFANKGAVTPSQLKAQAALKNGQQIQSVLESPAVKEAVAQAQANAKNAGRKMTADGSIEGLHNVKLAIDDMIKDPQTAAQRAKVAGLQAARSRVLDIIETLAPDYRKARQTYAAMSRPVNAFDVMSEAERVATANLKDLAGNPRMQANALAGALRDEGALIKNATGRREINALSGVLDPLQLQTLRAVASESDRAAAVVASGNGPGSATAQRMAAQNILRQIVGPTGLPSSLAESALANTVIGKPLNLVYGGVAEPKIQQALAEAVLDPAKARAFLAAAQKQGLKLPDNEATRALMRQIANTARISAPVAALPQPNGR